MGMKKRGFIAGCQNENTLSPREDNSVAAFTMHPSTKTTRTCRKRQTEEEQNKRRERERNEGNP